MVILAGTAESSQKALEIAGEEAESAIVDLTFAAEERPDARLRAPLLEDAEARADEVDPSGVAVIAHPGGDCAGDVPATAARE